MANSSVASEKGGSTWTARFFRLGLFFVILVQIFIITIFYRTLRRMEPGNVLDTAATSSSSPPKQPPSTSTNILSTESTFNDVSDVNPS